MGPRMRGLGEWSPEKILGIWNRKWGSRRKHSERAAPDEDSGQLTRDVGSMAGILGGNSRNAEPFCGSGRKYSVRGLRNEDHEGEHSGAWSAG